MSTYWSLICLNSVLSLYRNLFWNLRWNVLRSKIRKSSLFLQKFGKSSASRLIPKVVCCSITEFYLESLVLLSLASFFRKFLSRFFSLFMICHLYTQIERIRSLHPTVAISNSSSQTPNHCRNIWHIHMVIWSFQFNHRTFSLLKLPNNLLTSRRNILNPRLKL